LGSPVGDTGGDFFPLEADTGTPRLVGGVRGAPGRPKPPSGPCSMDLLHCANISSFMMERAAGSRAPAEAPGNKGCLKGPPSPGKLVGPPPVAAAAAAAAAWAVPAKKREDVVGHCRFSSVEIYCHKSCVSVRLFHWLQSVLHFFSKKSFCKYFS
jgi:hypothetical protein